MSKDQELPVAGWSCNRCNQFQPGERIPAKCTNCGGVEFRMWKGKEPTHD